MSTCQVEESFHLNMELHNICKCIETDDCINLQCTRYVLVCNELCTIGRIMMPRTKIVILASLQQEMRNTLEWVGPNWLQTNVWWLGFEEEGEKFVQACKEYQLISQSSNTPEPVTPTELTPECWQYLGIGNWWTYIHCYRLSLPLLWSRSNYIKRNLAHDGTTGKKSLLNMDSH